MVRPLTYFERILWRALKGLPANFAFVRRVRGNFTREDLEEACRGLCQRHPTLGTQVAVLADGSPWLVPTLAVPITVTRRQADDAWVECVRRELMLPFDWEQAPALRLIWLQDDHTSDLVTIWNHGLLDGLSALVVFRDLLTRLGQPAGYETDPLPLSPGIEDLIPRDLLRRRWLRLRMGAVVGLVKLLQTLPGEGLVVRSISLLDDLEVLPRLLTAEQTTLLVERCRSEGTTVLGSLCAAFLQAYADHAPAELARWRSGPLAKAGGKQVWRRRAACPVDLRAFLQPSPREALGQFLTSLPVEVDCSPGRGFWDIARAAKQSLSTRMTPARLLRTARLLRALRDGGASDNLAPLRALRKPRVHYDLSITNLGKPPMPTDYGRLRLETLHAPAVTALQAEQILAAITLGGRLGLTFSSHRSVLDSASTRLIFDDAIHRLAEASGWSASGEG